MLPSPGGRQLEWQGHSLPTAVSENRKGEDFLTANFRLMYRLIIVALLVIWVSGCGSSNSDFSYNPSQGQDWVAPDPGQSSVQLQALVNKAMTGNKVPGAIVGVWTPKGSWQSATGMADVADSRAATRADFSAWRSITKSLTVTIALQLVDEGRLKLDTPVSNYIDGVPSGNLITIRQLSNMTSGLFDYVKDPDFVDQLAADLTRSYTLDQLLEVSFAHPLNFTPGTAYEYSNINTLVLQKIVETATGDSLEHLLSTRIYPKLPVNSLQYLTGISLPDPHLNGYSFDIDSQTFEEIQSNATALAGAGALAGTMEGLRDWGRILVRGDLLSSRLQAQRFISRPPTNGPLYDSYGLGMGELNGWWGHTGNGLGYQACVFTEPKTESCIVVMLNATNSDSDVPAKLARDIQRQLGWSTEDNSSI